MASEHLRVALMDEELKCAIIALDGAKAQAYINFLDVSVITARTQQSDIDSRDRQRCHLSRENLDVRAFGYCRNSVVILVCCRRLLLSWV